MVYIYIYIYIKDFIYDMDAFCNPKIINMMLTCNLQGDSGGPYVCKVGDTWYQQGKAKTNCVFQVGNKYEW